ncbi:MAG: DUF3667 domain-containing protein [Pseudomonadota bacterium]
MAKKKQNAYTVCQNCGATLTGEYCHVCGQRADEPRRAVIGLVQDVFVDTLAIDGKLARTIWLLLSRPGRLARRYLDGKRVRYSPPFRLYLFASVFFFIAAFSLTDMSGSNSAPDNITEEEMASTQAAIAELEAVDPAAADEVRDAVAAAQDESGQSTPFTERSWEDDVQYTGPDWLEPHARRMFEAAQRAFEDPRLFFAEVRDNLPRVLLLAPVGYALILLLLYLYRRKYFVYDHFVVSLYMHAAFYAYLLTAMLLDLIPVVGAWLAAIPLLWGWLQPFVVFRQAYQSGWISAFLKWAVSITIYMMLLAVIITFGFSYSLYQSG